MAEHTCGVALTALLLAELVEKPVDRGRLLTMCLLHDLPETRILDLVPEAIRYLTPNAKRRAEEAALADLLIDLPSTAEFQVLWHEFDDGTSIEGRLARDADQLELLTQAVSHERAGWRQLGEFWHEIKRRRREFPVSEALFQALAAARPASEPDSTPGSRVGDQASERRR